MTWNRSKHSEIECVPARTLAVGWARVHVSDFYEARKGHDNVKEHVVPAIKMSANKDGDTKCWTTLTPSLEECLDDRERWVSVGNAQ